MNIKNERIKKLVIKGLTPEQIAKKLGLQNTDRVLQGIEWLKSKGEL